MAIITLGKSQKITKIKPAFLDRFGTPNDEDKIFFLYMLNFYFLNS